MTNLDTVLISVLTPLLSAIVGLIVWFIARIKHYAKQKDELLKRYAQLSELINYIAGIMDIIINDQVELKPDLKNELRIASEKYHTLDLIKL